MNFYSKQKRYLGDSCLLNLKFKSSILLAALTSISLQAQDYQVEDILPEPTPSAVKKTSSPEVANMSKQVSEPTVEESVVTEQTVSEPIVEEPVIAEQAVSEPVVEESVIAQQTVSETIVEEPVSAKQTVSEPINISDSRSPTCPADFFTLPLYPNAKFCQLFAPGLPASMSYFASSDQQSAKEFYINELGQAEQEKILNGRIVLQYSNGQKVLVISKDGQGSQIDILIKSAG
jgi:hypothetical protein